MANHGKLIQNFFWNFHFLGRHTSRFTGKLIQFLFRNFNSGASHRPFYWKTHPLKIMSTYSFEYFGWNHISYSPSYIILKALKLISIHIIWSILYDINYMGHIKTIWYGNKKITLPDFFKQLNTHSLCHMGLFFARKKMQLKQNWYISISCAGANFCGPYKKRSKAFCFFLKIDSSFTSDGWKYNTIKVGMRRICLLCEPLLCRYQK